MGKKYAGMTEDELRAELKAVAKDRDAVNELLEKALKDGSDALTSVKVVGTLAIAGLVVAIVHIKNGS
jgi:hypothetical protein